MVEIGLLRLALPFPAYPARDDQPNLKLHFVWPCHRRNTTVFATFGNCLLSCP